MKPSLIAIVLATTLIVGGAARVSAHKGHDHKVMGTIASVQGNHVEVKTTDGKTVMVMLDAKTVLTRGEVKVDITALTVGARVVAEGAEEKKMITAKTLKIGATR